MSPESHASELSAAHTRIDQAHPMSVGEPLPSEKLAPAWEGAAAHHDASGLSSPVRPAADAITAAAGKNVVTLAD